MKRYLIKVTYLDGMHTGESCLMQKGGYVTDEGKWQTTDTTYCSYNMAMRQCRRLAKENDLDWELETRDRAKRLEMGMEVKDWRIYNHEAYEPYEVEI